MYTNHQGSPLEEGLFLPSPEKLGVRDHLESQPEEKKNQSAMEQKPKSQSLGSVGIGNILRFKISVRIFSVLLTNAVI